MKIKTEWDLSSLAKSEAEFKKQREEIKNRVNTFVKKWKNNSEYLQNPIILKKALDDYEIIARNHDTGGDEAFYFWLLSQKDSNDANIKAKSNKVEEFASDIGNQLRFFKLSLSQLSKEKQNAILSSSQVKEYKHFLEKIFAWSPYRLSEAEENILALKEPVANSNWDKLTSSLLVKEERTINAKLENFSAILGLIDDENKQTRDEAAKQFNDILAKNSDVAEQGLNSIIQDKKINDKIRNAPRADTFRHLGDDIEPEIVDTLIKTVTSRFDVSQKVYALKAKLFKLPKLKYHERNIPYGKQKDAYTYEQSVELVSKVFKNLDPQFATIFKTFIENGQVDAFPKKGKRSGAFCVWWSPSKQTYVMLNHTNKIRDVRTIAHEFGHAINAELSKKQNALQSSTPTSTTEVASTFMEDFITQELLREADDETKLSLMVQKLGEDVSTIFRQIAGYNLETELHAEFRKHGYLSKETIGKIFQKHMASYMGSAVEQSEGSQNWWIYWDHITYYFYMYSYASGLLISKALQKKIKENPSFIKEVKEFLAAGGSDSPKNIFKKLGIDITKKEFWLSGIAEVEELLKETEALAKKLKKI